MPSQEILEKYEDVRSSLEKAIAVSDDIEISGEEENVELGYIRSTLNHLNSDFKAEIERLEKSSEWDKFCMAFFGETNAGKSTIIEALRIIYDEESRREEINKQSGQMQEELSKEKTKYLELVNALTQLNDSLPDPNRSKAKAVVKGASLVIIGVVIGFAVAFFML